MSDSLNNYSNMIVIKDETPEGALEKLRRINRPVKVEFMGSHRNKFVIIVGGDIRLSDVEVTSKPVSKKITKKKVRK